MRQAAFALNQDIQPMVSVPRHNHIGFPVPTISTHVRGPRAQTQAYSVLDALAGLPIWILRSPIVMVVLSLENICSSRLK